MINQSELVEILLLFILSVLPVVVTCCVVAVTIIEMVGGGFVCLCNRFRCRMLSYFFTKKHCVFVVCTAFEYLCVCVCVCL